MSTIKYNKKKPLSHLTHSESFKENMQNEQNNNNNNNVIVHNLIQTEVSEMESEDNQIEDEYKQAFGYELKKGINKKEYIYSLFAKKLFAELYFAWCKDCSEKITIDNAKYFRDEILIRNNRDNKNFNFNSLRIGKNFLLAFLGNLESNKINKLNLSDNLINDICMHNIKNIIATKKLMYLNLASNMISTEGLKIFQKEVIESETLKYLNLGVSEGSFRRNNFSGEGGLVLAKIILTNESLETLVLQDNELGEDSADKIGSSLIQNRTLRKLCLSDNKIKNKGAKSILENADQLISLNLSGNDILPEVCLDLYKLLKISKNIQQIYWDSNIIGIKGIKLFIEGIRHSMTLHHLSIKNTGIGNAGLKMLAEGLKDNKYLEILDVSSNSITFESFAELCDCLNYNKIKILKARNNLLGDESMKYFADIVLSDGSFSELVQFDFSSSKIYDQGLIYLLNKLQTNTKIKKIKLRDNYFSHEIDYVVLDFLENNTNLISFDLSKNRFSLQCIQKIQKIIDRNVKIQNDKEPNKLIVEVYRLKYENTKLNEMKETLKNLENDIEKIKLNRADIRLEYEIFKRDCDEEYEEMKKKIERTEHILNQRKNENNSKMEILNCIKLQSDTNMDILNNKFTDLKNRKHNLEDDNNKIKEDSENMEKDYIIRIEKMNNIIEENKKKETEFNKITKSLMEELIKIDKMITQKKNDNK